MTGPVEPAVEERGMETGPSEARLRELIAAQPYLGSWEEWAPVAYDRIPVMARMVMSHIYGRHDGTTQPYAHCVLCSLFRVESRPVAQSPEPDASRWSGDVRPMSNPFEASRPVVSAARAQDEPDEVKRLRGAIGPVCEIRPCDTCGVDDRLLVWFADPDGEGECIQCNTRSRDALAARLAAAERRPPLDKLFDALYRAMYGERSVTATEREAVAQLAEGVAAALDTEVTDR